MKYFFDALPEVEPFISTHPLLVLSDFDGTLSPIARRPDLAYMDRPIRDVLFPLSNMKNTGIGVISGRPITDVKRLVKIPGISYAGIHGWQWESFGKKGAFPAAKQVLDELRRIKTGIHGLVAQYPDVIIENKQVAFAVHLRPVEARVRPRIRRLLDALICKEDPMHLLTIEKGKQVAEIIPAGHPTKWDSVGVFRQVFSQKFGGDPYIIYMGDDATDEDVFRNLSAGMGIRVGYSKSSSAGYFVRSIPEVRRLLSWILTVRVKNA